MGKLIVYWFAGLLLIALASFLHGSAYPCEYFSDARKREYYPAIVIDKRGSVSCGKYGQCEDYLYVTLELDDGSYNEVKVTMEAFDMALVGQSLSLSRHVADPICVNHSNDTKTIIQLVLWYLVLTLALLLISMAAMAFMDEEE